MVNVWVVGLWLGKDVQVVIKVVKVGDGVINLDGILLVGFVVLMFDEYNFWLVVVDLEFIVVLFDGVGLVVLDGIVIVEFEVEGWVKDCICEL